MDQRWIHVLVILGFCPRLTSGLNEVTVIEGQSATVTCRPSEGGSLTIWFRVLDKSGMDFIASLSNMGLKTNLNPKFKINNDILTVVSFNKQKDSGLYSCAAIKSNELKFGEITKLVGVKDPVTAPAPAPKSITTPPCPSTTARPCSCTNSKQENPLLHCPVVILGPLAGACGLLLLLLIITTLYCNKIRTRRCPHHYKKRPQTMVPGKQMMTNRHV